MLSSGSTCERRDQNIVQIRCQRGFLHLQMRARARGWHGSRAHTIYLDDVSSATVVEVDGEVERALLGRQKMRLGPLVDLTQRTGRPFWLERRQLLHPASRPPTKIMEDWLVGSGNVTDGVTASVTRGWLIFTGFVSGPPQVTFIRIATLFETPPPTPSPLGPLLRRARGGRSSQRRCINRRELVG